MRERSSTVWLSLWAAAAVLLVVCGIAIPYGILGGGEPGWAVGGFWICFGLAVIALVGAGMAGWRDDA